MIFVTKAFMISRHPFTRILSAYRDKFEGKGNDDPRYYEFGRKIVEKYRSEKDKKRIKSEKATFKEFVNFLIDTKVKNDRHWKPVYWLTLPCGYNYTVFGKQETFSDDTNYIINTFNLKGAEPVWENRNAGNKDGDLLQTYYKQINKEELQDLYRLYHLDFRVFDYDYEPFISYVGYSTLDDQYDESTYQ